VAGSVHFSQCIPNPDVLDKVMTQFLRRFWSDNNAQDASEYAVMLAVVLAVTLMTVRLIGESSNNVFSQIGSKLS
jgi:Flp pilus assembly pilin Flp